jgi:hypothetical protein
VKCGKANCGKANCRKANCEIANGRIANCGILWSTVKIAKLRTSSNGLQ